MSRTFCCEVTNEIYRRLLKKTDDKGVIDSFMSFFHMHDYQSFFKGDEKAEPDLINYLEGAIESFEGEIKLLCVESFIYDFEQKMKPSLRLSGDRILYTRAMKFLQKEKEKVEEKQKQTEQSKLLAPLKAIGQKRFEDYRRGQEEDVLPNLGSLEKQLAYLKEREKQLYWNLFHPDMNLSKYTNPPFNTQKDKYPVYWEYQLSYNWAIQKIKEIEATMPVEELPNSISDKSNPEKVIRDKNNTARRQLLSIYYLVEEVGSHLTHNKEATARYLNFLTGKNVSNYSDMVGEGMFAETPSRRTDDLKYIRKYFQEMGLEEVVSLIDKDLNS